MELDIFDRPYTKEELDNNDCHRILGDDDEHPSKQDIEYLKAHWPKGALTRTYRQILDLFPRNHGYADYSKWSHWMMTFSKWSRWMMTFEGP